MSEVSKVNTTPSVVASAVSAARGTTSIASALGDALSHPKWFGGRKVIEREAAVYTHPSPVVTGPATSKLVDQVLLDDDSIVYQCRTCGYINVKAQSAVVHAASHSRTAEERKASARAGGSAPKKPRGTTSTTGETTTMTTTTKASANTTTTVSTSASRTATPAEQLHAYATGQRGAPVIPADVHEIVRNVRALAHQLGKASEALTAIAVEIIHIGEQLKAKSGPEITEEELEELRSKAKQLDTLKTLLNQ